MQPDQVTCLGFGVLHVGKCHGVDCQVIHMNRHSGEFEITAITGVSFCAALNAIAVIAVIATPPIKKMTFWQRVVLHNLACGNGEHSDLAFGTALAIVACSLISVRRRADSMKGKTMKRKFLALGLALALGLGSLTACGGGGNNGTGGATGGTSDGQTGTGADAGGNGGTEGGTGGSE
jgi:hypothetical protein